MYPDIHEQAPLVQPDLLLASQYFDRVRRRKDLSGEQRLLCAVLEDAVDVYRKHCAATDAKRRALFADAEAWIESDDRSWIYAFATVCDYLGLDPDYLRRGLRAIKEQVRRRGVARTPSIAFVDPPVHRRASNE